MKLDQMQEQQTDAQCGEYTIKDRAITRIGFPGENAKFCTGGLPEVHP